jgi:hypothetical protein
MIDLDCRYQVSLERDCIQVNQDGFEERTYTAAELQQALETENDFRRALALQEALDILTNTPAIKGKDGEAQCICLERVGDYGPCPVHR